MPSYLIKHKWDLYWSSLFKKRVNQLKLFIQSLNYRFCECGSVRVPRWGRSHSPSLTEHLVQLHVDLELPPWRLNRSNNQKVWQIQLQRILEKRPQWSFGRLLMNVTNYLWKVSRPRWIAQYTPWQHNNTTHTHVGGSGHERLWVDVHTQAKVRSKRLIKRSRWTKVMFTSCCMFTFQLCYASLQCLIWLWRAERDPDPLHVGEDPDKWANLGFSLSL